MLQRPVFDPILEQFVQASIFQRESLQPGCRVFGPAAIVEDETTIILPSSRQAVCQLDGCIDITEEAL